VSGVDLGEVITVNVNMFLAGLFNDNFTSWSTNTIPGEAKAAIDMRFPPNVDLPRVALLLEEWATAANVSLQYHVGPFVSNYVTSTDSTKNPWWKALQATLGDMGYETKTKIFPAGTDSARFRRAGIPAVGFSPIRRTPNRMHADNEYLDSSVFLEGIEIYSRLMSELSLVMEEIPDQSALLSALPFTYPLPGDPPTSNEPHAAPIAMTGMSYKVIAAIVAILILLAVISVLGVAKYRGGGFNTSAVAYSRLSKLESQQELKVNGEGAASASGAATVEETENSDDHAPKRGKAKARDKSQAKDNDTAIQLEVFEDNELSHTTTL